VNSYQFPQEGDLQRRANGGPGKRLAEKGVSSRLIASKPWASTGSYSTILRSELL